jgi:uncharacterized cofD-like protein
MRNIKTVTIGGGTGQSTLLSGLKKHPCLEISALVTPYDSGGSSVKLRDRFGILPPGDIFRCILALAPEEDQTMLRKMFKRRLADNHTPGNIFLFGAQAIYSDYQKAINELCKTFSSNGHVYPISLEKSNLCAELDDGTYARQETEIDQAIRNGRDIARLFLDPAVDAHKLAIKAIHEADLICLGPGSFYTSVLASLLARGIKDAIQAAKAPIIFIMNLLTEGLGMTNYDCRKFSSILSQYTGRRINRVVVNSLMPNRKVLHKYKTKEDKLPITLDNVSSDSKLFVIAPLWTRGRYARHDADKLGNLISDIAFDLVG